MTFLTVLLTLLYVFVCVALIFFVLIQASKGSGLSGAFGALGGSESLFGTTGSYTFVVKISVGLAVTFLFLSVLFGLLPKTSEQGVVERQFGTAQEAIDTTPSEDAEAVSPGGVGDLPAGE